MELKDWLSIASTVTAVAAVVIAILSILSSRSLSEKQNEQQEKIVKIQNEYEEQRRKADREREEQQRRADLEREEQQEEIERKHKPHIQFGIDCKFYGPEYDYYLVEFLLSAHNKGIVRHNFKNIRLRVRGIKANQPLIEWGDRDRDKGPRLYFPEPLLKEEVIPKESINFFFIEPGVEQIITYVTRLPSSIKYIVVHAIFEYDKYTPHTTERIFQLGHDQT